MTHKELAIECFKENPKAKYGDVVKYIGKALGWTKARYNNKQTMSGKTIAEAKREVCKEKSISKSTLKMITSSVKNLKRGKKYPINLALAKLTSDPNSSYEEVKEYVEDRMGKKIGSNVISLARRKLGLDNSKEKLNLLKKIMTQHPNWEGQRVLAYAEAMMPGEIFYHSLLHNARAQKTSNDKQKFIVDTDGNVGIGNNTSVVIPISIASTMHQRYASVLTYNWKENISSDLATDAIDELIKDINSLTKNLYEKVCLANGAVEIRRRA